MRDATKNQIIAEAKAMFREMGYAKMRMVELANRLNISRGNLTYYYSNKDALVEAIWSDYEEQIYHWIDNNDLPYFNTMTRRIYQTVIFDVNLFGDPTTRRFFREQIDSDGFHAFVKRQVWEHIHSMISRGFISFNSMELSYLQDSLLGAYRAMDIRFLSDEDVDIYQYELIKQKIRLNMFSATKPNVISDLEAALAELKSRDFSDVRCI